MKVRHGDLSGRVFGRLTVVMIASRMALGAKWLCVCSCGNLTIVAQRYLIDQTTQSCGCLHREALSNMRRTHGQSNNPLYAVRKMMIQRCHNPKNKRYPEWGGRGISVCQRWRDSVEAFLFDVGERPPGCSLDRIDNDGNYEPSNVRWATATEQSRNRRQRKDSRNAQAA